MNYNQIERQAIEFIEKLEASKNLSEDEMNILNSRDQIASAINYLYNGKSLSIIDQINSLHH